MKEPITVMYVCLGNICRSPAAEEILRKKGAAAGLSDVLHIESSGLGSWHIGCLPDARMREAASKRGYQLATKAQKFSSNHFAQFDYILAADEHVLHELLDMANSPEDKAKVRLITSFSLEYPNINVPDPYYNGQAAFEGVLDILESSVDGFIQHLKKSS